MTRNPNWKAQSHTAPATLPKKVKLKAKTFLQKGNQVLVQDSK